MELTIGHVYKFFDKEFQYLGIEERLYSFESTHKDRQRIYVHSLPYEIEEVAPERTFNLGDGIIDRRGMVWLCADPNDSDICWTNENGEWVATGEIDFDPNLPGSVVPHPLFT